MFRYLIVSAWVLLLFSCNKEKEKSIWTEHPAGYTYRLLAFNSDKFLYERGKLCKLSVVYKTQSDSIFWDSQTNLSDKFYITIDSSGQKNFIQKHASKSSVGDSVCLLIHPQTFFSQLGEIEIPAFVRGDSVVKIFFKVQEIFSERITSDFQSEISSKEIEQIRNFFSSEEAYTKAQDENGFFWLQRTENKKGTNIIPGQQVTIKYRGQLLDGRYVDSVVRIFELNYGTPDQVLTGLNYVIGRLKVGENAKIILPSRLAFGEYGSGDGSVPPHTPLIYDVSIIQ